MTLKQNKNSYLGNPKLKGIGVKQSFTKEQVLEIKRCSTDLEYFFENYIHIVTLDGGIEKFKMWDYQKELLKTITDNRFTIINGARQSSKSTVAFGFILHQMLFNANYNAAIFSNVAENAKDILRRLKLAYENIPIWMQQGVVEWNKQSIELENNSRVKVSTTTEDSGRSGSYNCIMLDEFAIVPNKISEAFMRSSYPTISSGKRSKIIMCSTPKGMNQFYKIWTNATNKTNSYIPVKINWWQVPGRDEVWKKQEIQNLGSEEAFNQVLASVRILVECVINRIKIFGAMGSKGRFRCDNEKHEMLFKVACHITNVSLEREPVWLETNFYL